MRFANAGSTNVIDYITISTLGDAIDFGDMPSVSGYGTALASSTRIAITRGYDAPSGAYTNEIKYVQIMTTGDAVDFGDMRGVGGDSSGFTNGHGGL